MKALKVILSQDSTGLDAYIIKIYEIIIKVIQSPIIEKLTDLKHENEIVFNKHIIEQQEIVLQVLCQFIEKYPKGLAPMFEELLEALATFEPANENQTAAWLTTLG